MPPYKTRIKPLHLVTAEFLSKRMTLSSKQNKDLRKWQKGYEGELRFDQHTQPFESDSLILHDLLLKSNSTTFQIDTLMITPEKVRFFEVKNHEGDHLYEEDKFHRLPKSPILNPLHQLQRAESLLTQLLSQLGYSIPVEGHLIFVNPHFTLYQAPINHSVIFPTQINSFLDKIRLSRTQITDYERRIADALLAQHDPNPQHPDMPTYAFDSLNKGIYCSKCSSFSIVLKGYFIYCKRCGSKEKFDATVLRMIHEMRTLFPSIKVTTTRIYHWCGEIGSPKRFRHVLHKHFVKKSQSKWTYFE